MTEQTETIELDDTETFREAMAEEPKQTEAERQRDEKGRFVAAAKEEAPPEAKQPEAAVETKQEAETPATEQPAEVKEEANVPSWRLREVREAREAAERRADEVTRERYQLQSELQAMRAEMQKLQQPKAEPVDFFADPDKAINQHLTPIEQKLERFMQDMTVRASRTAAIAQHGADAVAEMEKAIEQAMANRHPDMMALSAQMRSSDDPAGIAMAWHKRTKLMEQTGGDLEAYKNKLKDELLKDPKFIESAIAAAKTQAGAQSSRTIINLPPSLNKAPGAGNSESDDNDMSDRGIFKHAMRR